MAYGISTGAILQLTCKYAVSTAVDVAMTTHHYLYTGPAIVDGAAEAVAAAQEFKTQAGRWGQLWKATASELATLFEVEGQWVFPTRYQKRSDGLTFVSGTIVDTLAPPATSVAIERRGDLANRHSVGGVRVPATPSTISQNGDGRILAAYLPAWQALAAFMPTAFSTAANPGGTHTPVIYQRGNPAGSIVVKQGILHQTLRTLRRRVVGRGS
jgi:hypothetical protein